MLLSPETAAESGFARTLLNGEFAITAELVPPASGAPDELLALAGPFRGLVDALNVTDGPRAMVHMSALAASAILAREGIEPILQFTLPRPQPHRAAGRPSRRLRGRGTQRADPARRRPRYQRDPAAQAGVRRRQPRPDPDRGQDARRRGAGVGAGDRYRAPAYSSAPRTPRSIPSPAGRPTGLARKVEAGAGFVQTQLCWDLDVVRRYAAALEAAGLTDRMFLLIGIGPIASARSARWMRDNLWGVRIPDSIVDRLEASADQKAEGIAICAELIRALAEIPGVAGVHLMAPVGLSSIPVAIRESGVLENRTAAV